VSSDGDFIRVLRDQGYLDEDAVDPINDATFHYATTSTPRAPTAARQLGLLVLGIRNFESADFRGQEQGLLRLLGPQLERRVRLRHGWRANKQ